MVPVAPAVVLFPPTLLIHEVAAAAGLPQYGYQYPQLLLRLLLQAAAAAAAAAPPPPPAAAAMVLPASAELQVIQAQPGVMRIRTLMAAQAVVAGRLVFSQAAPREQMLTVPH